MPRATAKHPNLKIISWATFLAQKPAYRIGAYLTDGVHTTAAGTASRNSVLASPVAHRLPRVVAVFTSAPGWRS